MVEAEAASSKMGPEEPGGVILDRSPSEETPFDPVLLEIMVCPLSHAPLVHRDGRLLCYESRKSYRIENGFPVMMIEEAEEIPEDQIPEEYR